MEIDNSLTILEDFIVNNTELEALEDLIAEFNIFEAIGVVRQELRHSDFLAFLLNPSEKHGLGDKLLKRFLMNVLSDAKEAPLSPIRIDIMSLSNVIVERESQNIDILIHDIEIGFVCLIENKIYSGEHSNQLERYLEIVNRRFPESNIIPIFLSPEGIPPEDEESPYIPVSYGLVAKIIEQVREAQVSVLGSDVNTVIKHYTEMLRRHIVEDSKVKELCQDIYRRHKAAIDLIVEHIPDVRQDIADYLQQKIEETPNLLLDRRAKSYIDFAPSEWENLGWQLQGEGWTYSNRVLLFEFTNAQNRLSLGLVIGPSNEIIRRTIFDFAQYNTMFKTQKKIGKQWATIYRANFINSKEYKDASFDDLKEIIDKRWDKFFTTDLPEIIDLISNLEFPES